MPVQYYRDNVCASLNRSPPVDGKAFGASLGVSLPRLQLPSSGFGKMSFTRAEGYGGPFAKRFPPKKPIAPLDLAPGPTHLERLLSETKPEILETGLSAARDLLKQLFDSLRTSQAPDTDAWLKSIAKLNERDMRPRAVIGVVGGTGVGKSSIINALLDEERLLPTNCIRACTSSATELSYNYSDDPEELYRAEVEFISEKDWVKELEILFHDLLDSRGKIIPEAANANTDAGIAYARVHAVYPHRTKELIAKINPNKLAEEPSVRDILGSTRVLKAETAEGLYSQLQRYVDSGEKPTGSAKHGKGHYRQEYWPLVKVVRINTKADVLSTGAVIVDLPGVQDFNLARGAVANNYVKSCTGLWIVTPINRAVDDKVANTLLSDSFKRQLKYDGAFGCVGFICSKTDDISIREATESLGIDFSGKWEDVQKQERKELSLQTQISTIEESRAKLRDQLDACDVEDDLWDDLDSKLASGETVYAPPQHANSQPRSSALDTTDTHLGKRKEMVVPVANSQNHTEETAHSEKRIKCESTLENSESHSVKQENREGSIWCLETDSENRVKHEGFEGNVKIISNEKAKCESPLESYQIHSAKQVKRESPVRSPETDSKKRKKRESSEGRFEIVSEKQEALQPEKARKPKPLTVWEIEKHLSTIRSQRRSIRKEESSLNAQLVTLSEEVKAVKGVRDSIIEEIATICIKGRNKYSKDALKHDFARAVKESDQENAKDDATFDPEVKARDYKILARDLPVFCVSSRAYQKLSGKLDQDNARSEGFASVADTEIPKLREHVKGLTDDIHKTRCYSFLNELFQLVNSMKLWSMDNDFKPLPGGEQLQQQADLRALLSQLREDLELTLNESVDFIRKCLQENIVEKMHSLIPAAIEATPGTVNSWGVARNQGGLAYQTYKATVRRRGVYTGVSGFRDFNQDLIDPIYRSLANDWEQAFQHRLPAKLEGFADDTATKLEQFHLAVKSRVEGHQTDAAALLILSNQIQAHMRVLKELPTSIRDKITPLQRGTNRQLTFLIGVAMDRIYSACRDKRGPGSFAQMKDVMASQTNTIRHSMFHEVAEVMELRLKGICQTVKQSLTSTIHCIHEKVLLDYMRTFCRLHYDTQRREGLQVRAKVREILLATDESFSPVLLAGISREQRDDAPLQGHEAFATHQ
ncbi:hypothetical protein GGR50DRAFT_703194 [Xylaria sp. CBS 124048]|nr:hypothetical protein GGR50DRAFT_703194 [Xylaria sp. CBS 124048]